MGYEQNLETVRTGYAAFSSGDMAKLMALYNDDAVHIVPGSAKTSGAHKGKESILAFYGQLFELSGGTFKVELQSVLSDGGNRIVSIHEATMLKDGETVVTTGAIVFTFVDGKIAEMQDFYADIALNDRLFS